MVENAPKRGAGKVVLTRGQKMLARKVEKELAGGRTQRELAEQVGASEQSFWAWRHGTRRPGELMKTRLETFLGIPSVAWLTAHERKAFARSRSAA